MRARTPIVSIGCRSPVIGMPASIVSRFTTATSDAASVIADAARPPPPPPREGPVLPLVLSRATPACEVVCAALAWPAESALHAVVSVAAPTWRSMS